MTALHVRDVPDSVVAAIRERADRHGHSMQQELRQILERAASDLPPIDPPAPIQLVTVKSAGKSAWSREEIYGDTGR